MRKLLFVHLLALLFYPTFGQQQSNEERLGYYTIGGFEVSSPSLAKYYRTLEVRQDIFFVREYYMSGVLEMEAECSEYQPKLVFHGKVKYYRDNGTVREEATYKDGLRAGTYTQFYENGKPWRTMESIDNKTHYHQYYAENGAALLEMGTGILTDTNDEGDTIYTQVKDQLLVSCYTIKSPSDTAFLIVEQIAAYPGGLTKLSSDIGRNLKYPAVARRRHVSGTVYVSFVIRKTGKIDEVSVVKGIGEGCDEEALRVVSKLGDWKPAIERGRVVNSRYVLPIKFKLDW